MESIRSTINKTAPITKPNSFKTRNPFQSRSTTSNNNINSKKPSAKTEQPSQESAPRSVLSTNSPQEEKLTKSNDETQITKTLIQRSTTRSNLNKCEFNPCMNGGRCIVLEDKKKFICSCKDFYHGVYCEYSKSFIFN
jgi:hypothetical protein